MRILLLTQIVPYPPDSGPKIKTYNVLRYLAQRHEVHLVSFVRADEQRHLANLQTICASVTAVALRRSRPNDIAHFGRSMLNGRPFLIERDDLPSMRQAIQRLLQEYRFDAVHADQLSMGQFAVDLPVERRVLDEHNAVWTIVRRSAQNAQMGPFRLAAELEWRKLRAYEGDLCQKFDHVTVVSRDDQRALSSAARGPIQAIEIPIAVDTDALPFVPRPETARDVLSVATMFYPPNVEGVAWFATQSFPHIRRALPQTQFYVVGARPPTHIQRLAGDGIVVTGYVADLDPILRNSAVLIVPLHAGSGMRVKILEAFARGIPVVSTSVGVEGIDAVPGEHLLVGDTGADFARAVMRVIQEPETAAVLARNARALVERRYDWRVALRPLDRLYPA